MAYYMFFLTLFCVTNLQTLVTSLDTNTETYIVHVELPPTSTLSSSTTYDDLQAYYQSFLSTTSASDEPHIIYSYHNVFHGFAARLTPAQAKALEKRPGYVSARPQKTLPLHTTHSPNFLGLNQNTGLWKDTNYGRGVIIGLLDTGITPDHPSFDDEGMPPPPAKWKGSCEFNTCNNKLIGARSFSTTGGTPYDEDGHDTHTASTAAGSFVRGANVFGNANGTAAGIAPLAHIAVYKVCNGGCSESDILAAMDVAIDDGVDIISLSLGGFPLSFYDDSIAVGAFSAVERGIFVSASAGNYGPFPATVANGAPWILTVGATTIDRKIIATAVLGNKEELEGESTFQPRDFPSTLFPLVYPEFNSSIASCGPESLQNVDVSQKIVLCEVDGITSNIRKAQAVKDGGGTAMILINQEQDGYTIESNSYVIPATHLSYMDGIKIKAYLNSTSSPTAGFSFKGTIIGDPKAPALASFSSRGPNRASLGILKPDIVGPGHNILAAWHISVENNTNTKSNFNIISGTSMSCPHLSGVAALLKIAHPDWSPAAIKSAIMTTADIVNLGGNRIQDLTTQRTADVLGIGSGHVNVVKATEPGLVYDILSQDYLSYLCGLNYTDRQVGVIANHAVRCSEISSISEAGLNYPSFSVFLGNAPQSYNRTVTNVGEADEVYTVGISGLPGVEVKVEPTSLQFSGLGQRLMYQTTFSRMANASDGEAVQGFLTWNSAKHSVRSPIIVFL